MAKARTFAMRAVKDSGWTAIARVQNPSGVNITQASLTSITLTIKDQDGTITYGPTTLTVASVVFDTLQGADGTDSRWTVDSTGYNFLFEVPATAFPASGHHRAEFVFNPVTGENYPVIYEGVALSLF